MSAKRVARPRPTAAPLLPAAVALAAAPAEAAEPPALAEPLAGAMLDTGHRRKQQYPGTWSHTDRTDIKAPKELSKRDFGDLLMRLLDTIFRAVTADGARRSRQNRVQRISIFQELHESGEIHYHFNVLAELPWSFAILLCALQAEKIFVDPATRLHDYYWTSFIYCTVPGADPDSKAGIDLDREPWLSPGHPTVQETIADIPRGARAVDKKRVRRYLGVESGESTKKDLSLTDKEFAAHVLAKGLETLLELQAWVTTTRDRLQEDRQALPEEQHMAFIGIEAYMFKNQADLRRRINFAWEASRAPNVVRLNRMTAWEFVVAARTQTPCVCGGRWPLLTEELLDVQVRAFPLFDALPQELPSPHAIKAAMRKCLQHGGDKHSNIYFYGPKNAGKSHMLKPMVKLFGQYCFVRPVGKTDNYPLQEIFGKKAAVLQDLRTTTYNLPWDALLVWFEAEDFMVPLPQNHFMGNKLYDEKAPIFASSGSKLRISRKEAESLQVDPDKQNDMMDTRWVYFRHTVSMDAGDAIPPCPRCFSEWLCRDSPVIQAPDVHNVSIAAVPAAAQTLLAATAEAKDAMLDFLETHGSIFLQGPRCNVKEVAIMTSWGQRFHATCGRLRPFLQSYGITNPMDCDEISEFVFN